MPDQPPPGDWRFAVPAEHVEEARPLGYRVGAAELADLAAAPPPEPLIVPADPQ